MRGGGDERTPWNATRISYALWKLGDSRLESQRQKRKRAPDDSGARKALLIKSVYAADVEPTASVLG